MRNHIRTKVTRLTSFERAFDVSFECLACGEGRVFHVSDPRRATNELRDEHFIFMNTHLLCPEIKDHFDKIMDDMLNEWEEKTDPAIMVMHLPDDGTEHEAN